MLSDLLTLVSSDSSYHAIIELKTNLSAQQQTARLTLLNGLEDRIYLNAFNARLSDLQQLKTANPQLHISLLGYQPVLPLPQGIEGQDLLHSNITQSTVDDLHNAGAVVRAWVPNKEVEWQDLTNMGVDGIITNKSSVLADWTDSNCSTNPPAPEPEEPPSEQSVELISNTGFETGIDGREGLATAHSHNTRSYVSHTGNYSLRSINTANYTAKHGFAASQAPVNENNPTSVGQVYTASVWVKPDAAGQKINIYLREKDVNGNFVDSKTVMVQPQNTNWHEITNQYTASSSNGTLEYHVFAYNSAPNQGFYADDISLIKE